MRARQEQEDTRRNYTRALAAQRRRGTVEGDGEQARRGLSQPLVASTSSVDLADTFDDAGMQDYRQLDYRLHRAGTAERHWRGINELAPRPQRPRSLLTVVILVLGFLASLGGSTTGAPLTELLVKRACDRRSLPYPSQICSGSSAAQSEAATRTQWIYLSSLPGLLTLGTYSLLMDVRGRRLVLVLGVLSASVFPLLISIVPDTPVHIGSVSIDGFTIVIAGAALASLCGASAGKIAQFAVISDLTEGMDGSRRKVLFMALEVIQWIGNVRSSLPLLCLFPMICIWNGDMNRVAALDCRSSDHLSVGGCHRASG